MRLALLGRDISHSKSPELYREILGSGITYELLDIPSENELPSLVSLGQRFDAINITSPYKTSYVSQVIISDKSVLSLGAVNSIWLKSTRPIATNTDLLGVRRILKDFHQSHPSIHIILLGGGTMAKLTQLVCKELGLPITQHARALGANMSNLDLSHKTPGQTLIINSCSRKFVFSGKLHPDHIFWDFNYGFIPHQNSLPNLVKTYIDGQSLLRIQAEEAVNFWKSNKA